jgi:putative CocE/NonD family hydrolase
MTLESRSAFVLSLVGCTVVGAYLGSMRYARAPVARHDFEQIDAMVPMRDGVKLQTVVFVPKDARGPLPILLQRTPYGVPENELLFFSPGFADLREDGYIFAFQNLRGRFRSEGTFVMLRPPRDRADAKAVDESTDAYDTVEWLVKNVPGNSGKAGIWGTSYPGWTTQMALLDPHPAVACASERASPSDMFANDDFHHNGAFRLSYGFEYAAMLETAKDANTDFQFGTADTYDWYLQLGALSHADERYFHGKVPSWEDFVSHPNRDSFWEKRALGTYLDHPIRVPNLNVAGWWDQEDFVGPVDIYEHVERFDREAHANYLVVGPWNHGGWGRGGSHLGPIDFGADRSAEFRAGAQRRWFAHWLRGAPAFDQPEAQVFETGTNRWRSFDSWPPASGVTARKLYFHAGGRLSFEPPVEEEGAGAFDAYVSDPASPVPYRRRPIGPTYQPPEEWPTWLVQDQRFVEHRPDVLTWSTDALDHDVVIAGEIVADLFASTTGTDADWVVKLIDVLPDGPAPGAHADGGAPDLRGYELMIAADVLRARFRTSLATPVPVPADAVVEYSVDLHTNAHAFQRGHRIMVQVQSSWFPLIDRNPQKYVDNIYRARDEDFTSATQRVHRSPSAPSSIVLPVLDAP